ncbi:IS66 family transposase [Engelhardtia mirabilis]|uniref:Transposase IS66 family protein n=1 Tax=Engelhardtia mirabilis TaxID=2528011 RepID=A0A518BNJ1_9BACT|nr:Transposase IS66 family protein [Planctomycetes bacterium Pla133]QDU68503.1 Transposase IS66 family protein [Planctomycetes bacterium Pla133]QDV02223.1 Transposase IS66 family protein [Planctomycetes bacterium Pla86]QDV02828.1 Transposase IS66 family protein [Planctomycetes bacterium Pla86]
MTPLTDIDEANAQLQTLHSTVEEQQRAIDAKSEEIAVLREQLAHLQRHLFGRRRETIDPNQLRLFETSQALLTKLEEEVAAMPRKPKREPAKGHGRAPFPEDLPRQTVTLDVPEADRSCPDCSGPLHEIGVEVTERGHLIPARFVVKRYERRKYACKDGHTVKVAPLPDGVIDGGKYEASVYAHVATSKYADHLPLNRIQSIFKRDGVHFARQTMWDLMVRLDEIVARPVLREMRRQLLEEEVLQADETPIAVQTEGQKGTRRGQLWAWRNVRGSPEEKVLADFWPDRSAKEPAAFLGDWSGTLLTDGYDGVNPVADRNGIVRAGCWAHARRKFVDALDSNQKKAAAVLRPIQRLFWIERAVVARAQRDGLELGGLAQLRATVRDRRSRHVLETIFEVVFALDEDASIGARGSLGKAARYVINQREPLTAMLRDGRLPIHNNDTERALRHVAVGRKNWGIFGSQRGGEVAARLYSLTMSCKLAEVPPDAYIEDVIQRVSTTPQERIAELTPWGWKARQAADVEAQANS